MANEQKEKEVKIIPRIMIDYSDIGGQKVVSIIVKDKDGNITKIREVDDKAISTLKKFVNAL